MFSVVQYTNGVLEVLPSKKIKKYSHYAVAKNYEVSLLCENKSVRFCKSFISKQRSHKCMASENLDGDEINNNKIQDANVAAVTNEMVSKALVNVDSSGIITTDRAIIINIENDKKQMLNGTIPHEKHMVEGDEEMDNQLNFHQDILDKEYMVDDDGAIVFNIENAKEYMLEGDIELINSIDAPSNFHKDVHDKAHIVDANIPNEDHMVVGFTEMDHQLVDHSNIPDREHMVDFDTQSIHLTNNISLARSDTQSDISETFSTTTVDLVQHGLQKYYKKVQQKHCCFYCHKKICKIYRHYLGSHKDRPEVKEILLIQKKTKQRRDLLDMLRKKGDYFFNTNIQEHNEEKIVCRKTKNLTNRDLPCPNCLGYYSKLSIRHHIAKCMNLEKKGKRRNIQGECRKFENRLHPKASKTLREKIFPILREDEITNVVRYDELVITYANFLCRKYTLEHHSQQIRANIRTLGRLILVLRKLNPAVHNLVDVFEPCHIDLIVQAIDSVAGFNETSHMYKSPGTATLLTAELKKLCKIMEMEFIKLNDRERQKKMEDLLILFNLEFQGTVNKKSMETQKINQRRRKRLLPKTDQIGRFRIYLEDKIQYFTDKLESRYSLESWTHLCEYTLAHLAIFNRKRPGETQRILIDDYKNYEVADDEDIMEDANILSHEQVKKWARVRFTGKLGKNTALLIHRDLGFRAINLILKYQVTAGVNPVNRYVFGEPSQFLSQNTFQACKLISKLAAESGIENCELLRTRFLRQHLATETAKSSVDPKIESRISDFMSHKRQIHEDFYVLTQKTDDITKVSTLLEKFSSTNKFVPETDDSLRSKNQTSVFTDERKSSNANSDDYWAKDNVENSDTEVNYIMGKSTKRRSWSALEKETAMKYFHDEIFNGSKLCRQKVNTFFYLNKNIYQHRTAHLIMQWIKCERNKVEAGN